MTNRIMQVDKIIPAAANIILKVVKIMMGAKLIDQSEWRVLLSGGTLAGGKPRPDADWVESKMWIEIINLSQLPKFAGFDDDFAARLDEWRALYDSAAPETHALPGEWDKSLDKLEKLLVLRCVRPDKCVPAIQNVVEASLGRRFIEPPPFDLGAAFNDSSVGMPLIFVLSPGQDPMAQLLKFADGRGFGGNRTQAISLGQGQGPLAQRLLSEALAAWIDPGPKTLATRVPTTTMMMMMTEGSDGWFGPGRDLEQQQRPL